MRMKALGGTLMAFEKRRHPQPPSIMLKKEHRP